jgi:hypothetical protein
MSQLVKMKRQANFKDFKRFGAFKGLVEQKKTLNKLHITYFVCLQKIKSYKGWNKEIIY